MKKPILVLFVLAVTAINAFSQIKSKKVDYTWGVEQKVSRKTTLGGIFGHDDTGVYVWKYTAKMFSQTVTLEHYNQSMIKTKSAELVLQYKEKDMEFESLMQINNKLYVFSSLVNQKDKKNFLFVQTINPKTLMFNGDIKKIAEINFEKKSKANSGNFDCIVSSDESKILIYYNLPYEKKENEKFGFHVYDKDFNTEWEKEVTVPYSDELFTVYDYKVDNQGVVHLLGKKYNVKAKEERNGEVNYSYQILSYFKNGNELVEYPINVEGKYLKDINISIPNEKEIICTGFYSESNSSSIKGAYYLRIDIETKTIKIKTFKDFDFDVLTENMTDKQKKKARKKENKGESVEMYEYDMSDIIIRDDGGAILVAEQYYMYVTTYTTTSSNGVTSTHYVYHYYYNDILVINISANGEIEWTKKIPKYQHTINDSGFYSSYSLALVNNKMYFIFNDNPKNLFNKENNKVYSYAGVKNNVAVLVEIDEKGNMSKEPLFMAKDAGVIIRPKVSAQINDNDVILFGQYKKKQKFVKLTFK